MLTKLEGFSAAAMLASLIYLNTTPGIERIYRRVLRFSFHSSNMFVINEMSK